MPSKSWRFRLDDILEAIARIQSYTQGMTFEQFQADSRTIDAVERNFIVIGEAARHVPDHVTVRWTSVEWREMRDMRNVVVHAYRDIELERVWATVQHDLPPLVPLLQAILDSEDTLE